MIIRCTLLILFLNCATTTQNIHRNGVVSHSDFDRRFSYSFWPSIHNAAKMIKLQRRDVKDQVQTEGGEVVNQVNNPPAHSSPEPVEKKNQTTIEKQPEIQKVPGNVTSANETVVTTTVADEKHEVKNETATMKTTPLDLNNPGVVKRGLIVFGGFALLAVAYFIFYRMKSNKNDAANSHSLNDTNQFRYGVLQSEDKRHNLELSRVPLTMESDEDEDEDLEIFDLGQKKKSLSYVNLQTNDEDIVLNSPTESSSANNKDNLLLDIEDASTDTLINWSNNGSKSIL
ncbi:uncharacterized protein LOC113523379 [Galleria mellonella]|uniref:Uncharacterized protein LOC113523379 n=1 Tax=Galleria mellonella TaxID=7137 RepID=A0A6J1X9P3_GALME|nr:uncharacterized protein LOC113523379 [Galleria mellonella]